jgi:hypothetical protein
VGGRPKSVKQKMESVGIGTLLRVLSPSHTHTHSHVLTSRAAKNQKMAPKKLNKTGRWSFAFLDTVLGHFRRRVYGFSGLQFRFTGLLMAKDGESQLINKFEFTEDCSCCCVFIEQVEYEAYTGSSVVVSGVPCGCGSGEG